MKGGEVGRGGRGEERDSEGVVDSGGREKAEVDVGGEIAGEQQKSNNKRAQKKKKRNHIWIFFI